MFQICKKLFRRSFRAFSPLQYPLFKGDPAGVDLGERERDLAFINALSA